MGCGGDRICERPGARLSIDVRGRGRTTIAAHGLLASRGSDDAIGLMNWDALVQAGLRLVRYDARAHGTSTGRAQPSDYTWRALGRDLLAVADYVDSGEPVHAVGVSMGSGTLLWSAAMSPERFERLVLVIPPTVWETRDSSADRYLKQADTVERFGIREWIFQIRKYPVPEILADVEGLPNEPDVGEELLPSVLRGAARSDLPAPELISGLSHPTLILAWPTDATHPVSTAVALARLLPNCELRVANSRADIDQWPARIAEFLASRT